MGRVNLHESKFLILVFLVLFALSNTYFSTAIFKHIISRSCMHWSSWQWKKKKYFIHLGHCCSSNLTQPEELYNFCFKSLHVLFPEGAGHGFSTSSLLSPSLSHHLHTLTYTSLPQQEGNTKTPRQKINKTRQAICPARTTRKQDSPVCQCKQSLGNILFAL